MYQYQRYPYIELWKPKYQMNIALDVKNTTVSGHKCFIKLRIPIDLRVFPCLLFK